MKWITTLLLLLFTYTLWAQNNIITVSLSAIGEPKVGYEETGGRKVNQ